MENQIALSIGNILTVIGGFGVVFGAFYKLLSKKFEGIDKKIETLDNKFDKKFEALENKFDKKIDKLDEDIKDLRNALTLFEKNTEHRFGKIETRLSVMENEQKNTNQRLSTIESYIAPRKVYEFKESKEEDQPKEN